LRPTADAEGAAPGSVEADVTVLVPDVPGAGVALVVAGGTPRGSSPDSEGHSVSLAKEQAERARRTENAGKRRRDGGMMVPDPPQGVAAATDW